MAVIGPRCTQSHIRRVSRIHITYYLVTDVLADAVSRVHGHKVSILDFGSGDGLLTNLIATRLFEAGDTYPSSSSTLEFYGREALVVGYDIPGRSEQPDHVTRRETVPNLVFTDRLPPSADIAICHFSLHHQDDPERTLREQIVGRLNPEVVIIVEYDFTAHNPVAPPPGAANFQKFFNATDAERKELAQFAANAGGDAGMGLQRCYAYHQRWGVADFAQTLQKLNYQIDVAYNADCPFYPGNAYKFCIYGLRR